MRAPTITLVALPWHALSMPSIQLGTLCAVLGQAGIATEVRSLMLAFMEHCVAETEGRPEGERITVADYATVAEDYASRGLGDWIFAIPSFRDDAVRDAQYVAYLRDLGVPETVLGKALVMRTLVPAFLDRCVEEILASRPRIVGFTTTFSQNVPSLVVAKRLRERDPAVAIVFGGGNCDGPMGAALHRAFPWIDVVVRGEAEGVLPDLVRDLFAGGPVRPAPGLCYREGDQQVVVPQQPATPVTMDDVPMPIMDEYFERLEKTSFAAEVASRVSIPFETSRGCWWGAKSHCTFCGLNGTSMAFRSKSPARVVDELAALAHRHQRLDFTSVDTILDLEYLREVMPRLR